MKSNTESTPEGLLAKHIRQQGVHLVQLAGLGKGRSFPIAVGETSIGTDPANQIQVSDPAVSRRHCVIEHSEISLRIRDLQSTNGTLVDGVSVDSAYLRAGSHVRLGGIIFGVDVGYAPVQAKASVGGFRGLVGQSAEMRAIFAARSQLAQSDATVLVQGETGTGKSALARSIHQASQRREKPFVVFDCSAVSPTLIESELFGHEKGSFTGAEKTRLGALEAAGEGTLFIDELTELPLDLQPKLLRALEEREFKPLGSSLSKPVKCRIIAATQHDAWALAEAGKFRKDLYFRIAVVVVPLPPLRERKEDLVPIVDHLLTVLESPFISFSHLPDDAREQILRYDWPGNIRELRNFLERYLVTRSASLPKRIVDDVSPSQAKASFDLDKSFQDIKKQILEDFERSYLLQLLRSTGHNVSSASKRSGISRRHLHDMMVRYGLDKASLVARATADDDEP